MAYQSVLKHGAIEDKGEYARLQTFVGALAIGDVVKSTLGPWGMSKLLQPARIEAARHEPVNITNDGATILKSLWAENPAAKVLIDVSLQQDVTCGDGTTGVVVLAAELLRNAEILSESRLHPQAIIQGYRTAATIAKSCLAQIAVNRQNDPKAFKQDLLNIAKTTLSSKFLSSEKEKFAHMAVDALMKTADSPNPLELIQIIKKVGGTLPDSYLEDGFILEKKLGMGQPLVIENCNVLVANTPMDSDKIKIYGARVKVDHFQAVENIEQAEMDRTKEKVEKIVAHKCNLFINRQLIYNYPEQQLKMRGVYSIEHADFEGMERLAKVLDAEVVSTFDTPEKVKLGHCDRVEQIYLGGDPALRFVNCKKGAACTIVLRGSSFHVLDEAARSLHDALAVLSQTMQCGRVVCGGGAAEMAMADAIEVAARQTEGKTSFAMDQFAAALRRVAAHILENGGLDSAELISRLRARHARNEYWMGIDFENESIGDTRTLGVLESYKSKYSQISSAAEAAEMIIRVDDIIKCRPRDRRGV